MLSRVAESLYWMARYSERAEAVARLAAVNYQASLDGGREDAGWDDVVRITSDVDAFRGRWREGGEPAALEFLVSSPGNPNAVLGSLSRARENARVVRDQVSAEMWEHLNRLYLWARDGSAGALARDPYSFFRQVRDGTQAFEGVTAATMTHGEAYEFIQLGRYLERAITTVRTLAARYDEVCAIEDGTTASSLALMALLKSCGAFEPFRRHHGSSLQAAPVAEYLMLNPLFPRSVLFCLERAGRAVAAAVAPLRASDRVDGPGRLLGRLRADLSYLDVNEMLDDGLYPLLDGLLRKMHDVCDEVTRTYFNTRVILPAAKGGARQQQQQQQQAGSLP